MTDSVTVFPPGFRVTDANDLPISGATIEFYAAGTTTPKTVYADASLSTSIGTSITTDAGGYPTNAGQKALIYTNAAAYKIIFKDSSGSTFATHDNVKGAIDTSSFGSGGGSSSETSVISKTTDYEIVAPTDNYKLFHCDPTGGTFQLTLPSAVTAGDGFTIGVRHNGIANQVKIASVAGQYIKIPSTSTVNGVSLIASGEQLWLVSDGAGWVTSSRVAPGPGATATFFQIVSRVTSPPASIVPGGRYLINGTPAGTFNSLGFADKDIVEADGQGGWTRYTPLQDCGWLGYVQDEGLLVQFRVSTWAELNNVTNPAEVPLRVMEVRDQRASGSAVSVGTAGAWNQRILQTVPFNTILVSSGASANASLAANTITLPRGRYFVSAVQAMQMATANTSGVVRGRFRGTSGTTLYSNSETIVAPTSLAQSNCATLAIFSVLDVADETEDFVLEYYATNTPTLGAVLALSGINETYSTVSVIDLTARQGAVGPRGPQGPVGPGYAATSLSAMTLGTGTYTFTTQAGLAYAAGQRVRISNTAAPSTRYMVGNLTSYSTTTMVVEVDKSVGSGSYSSWTIGVDGEIGYAGTTVPDISGLSELALSDDESDFEIIYDTSATAHKKVKPKNAGFTASSGTLRSLQSKLRETIHASDYSSINAAVSAIGSTSAVLVVSTACTLTASLTIPSTLAIEFRKGGSIAKASSYTLTIAGPIDAGPFQIFSGFASGDVTFGYGLETYGEWWGAVGDNATDDRTALQSAISAQPGGFGSGGHLQLLAKKYAISNVLTISKAYVGIKGKGQNVTLLHMTSSTNDAIAIAGVFGASINNCFCYDFGIYRSSAGTAGTGISLAYTGVAKIRDVHISDMQLGMSMLCATNTIAERVLATYTIGSTNGFYGFSLDCSGSGPNGNASSVFRDCWASSAGAGGSGHIGFYVRGNYVSDLIFDACETASTHIGFYFDCSTSLDAGNEDVQLLNCRSDFYTTAGIHIKNATGDAMFTIMGGWLDPKSVGATSAGIRLETVRGVSIENMQFFALSNNAGFSRGIHATSSQNIVAKGCLLDNHEYGLYLDTVSYSSFVGNRFWAQTLYPATSHIHTISGVNISFASNILDGYAGTGIYVDAGSSNTVLSGNTINATNISTPVSNAGTGTLQIANVGGGTDSYAKIANNLSDMASKVSALDNISVHGIDVASASTVNLETASGDLVDVTGTTTITAITLSEGHERTVRFTGALTLTNGASLVLPGAANITTAAGDFAVFRGYAAGVVRCVQYSRASTAPLGTARTTYTPIVTASSGSFTTVSATGSYYDIGSLRFVDMTVTITTNGTAAGLVRATLPSTPVADFNNGMGREVAAAGFMLGAYGFSSTDNLSIFKLSDSSYPGGSGYQLNVQAYYRTV